MNFTIEKSDLLKAMKSMLKVVPNSSPIKELEGFLIETDKEAGEIIITANNLEAAIQRKLKAVVSETGSFVVDARLIVNIAVYFDSDKMNFIGQENGRVVIKGKGCKYEVSVLSAKSYPKPEIPFPDDTIKVSGICDLFSKTVAGVGHDTNKLALTGIHLEIYSDCIQAVGCDSFRMAVMKHNSETGGKLAVTIPKNSLYYLAGAVENSDSLEVGICGNSLVFMMKNMLFSTRLINEDYLDTERLLSSIESLYTAKVDSKKLSEAINVILACADGSDDNKMNMFFNKKEIIFDIKNNGMSSNVSVDAVVSEPMPVGGFWYNPVKFADCFKTVSGELELHVSKTGILIAKNTDAQYMLINTIPPKKEKKSKKTADKAA